MNFHEILFPVSIALDARGGPERRTDVVTLASGKEERNARWQHSKRKYEAGLGVRSLADLRAVVAFFEERRGKLYGFRYRDPLDFTSSANNSAVAPGDCTIGIGNGVQAVFQLKKIYGMSDAAYHRPIKKPVSGTCRFAVNGTEKTLGTHATLDGTTGLLTFASGHIPASGDVVTAGFHFDVPVRFDTDMLDINLRAFRAGDIPSIPLIEVLL